MRATWHFFWDIRPDLFRWFFVSHVLWASPKFNRIWNQMRCGKSAGANQERLVLALTVLEITPRRKEKMSMTLQMVLSSWSGSMATMQKRHELCELCSCLTLFHCERLSRVLFPCVNFQISCGFVMKVEVGGPMTCLILGKAEAFNDVTFELSLARECEGQFGTVSLLNSLLRIIAACCGQATLKVPYALQLHCSIFHGCGILPSLLSWNFNFVFLCTQLWVLNGWKFNWLKVRLTKISTDWKFNCHEHQTMFNSIQTSYQQVMSSQMKS